MSLIIDQSKAELVSLRNQESHSTTPDHGGLPTSPASSTAYCFDSSTTSRRTRPSRQSCTTIFGPFISPPASCRARLNCEINRDGLDEKTKLGQDSRNRTEPHQLIQRCTQEWILLQQFSMDPSAKILEAVDWLNLSRSPKIFAARATPLARTCIPSAVVAYHRVSVRGVQHHQHHCDDDRATPVVRQAWRRHALNSPVVRYYLAGGTNPVIATRDLISFQKLKNSELYEECWKPFNVTHQVGLRLWNATEVSGLSIKRDGFFRDAECQLLQALYPHFDRAWREATRAHETGLEDRGSEDDRQRGNVRRKLASSRGVDARFASLTFREREVLSWIAEGKRNAEIAVILNSSPATVKTQAESIFRKLHVETRGSASAIWHRHSLL